MLSTLVLVTALVGQKGVIDNVAPRIGYVSVSSRLLVGRRDGTPRERVAWLVYRDLLGDRDADAIEGDGLVPVRSALLPGAASLVFDDVSHGQWPGRPWYGSDEPLDRWWPLALRAWNDALCARATAAASASR